MKKKRQDTILSLIAAEEIPTQEVLRERMEEHGFAVTQATLSRDIRELKLTKERRGSGRACYTAPVRQEVNGGILQNAALRTDFAGNVAVIHCRTGTAQAVAAALDAMHRKMWWEPLPEMIPFLYCCGQKYRQKNLPAASQS
mgnify:CR=1 FL=1